MTLRELLISEGVITPDAGGCLPRLPLAEEMPYLALDEEGRRAAERHRAEGPQIGRWVGASG
jgi:hypothetical protein